ncbi:MAG: hypothetical protein AB1394_11770 [Bacteroidota bacterium]
MRSVVNGRASYFEVNSLIKYTHQFASVRLTQILRTKKIISEILPHSITTVALDCIAEIFHRDSDGNFIELQHYFSGEKDLTKTEAQEAFINFRRIVFSKINDGIFRIYKEYDPITSKVIRNIKLIFKRSDKIYSICRFGEVYYTLTPDNLNEAETEMPPEELETELVLNYPFIHGLENQVTKLLEILSISTKYRRFYSLVDLALIIKNIYIHQNKIIVNNLDIDKDLIDADIKQIVQASFIEIGAELESKYLRNHKIEKLLFEQYTHALKELLTDTFIKNDGANFSHFDYLCKVKDDLSYEEYRTKHRASFEYFVKISKTRIINNLKDFFD